MFLLMECPQCRVLWLDCVQECDCVQICIDPWERIIVSSVAIHAVAVLHQSIGLTCATLKLEDDGFNMSSSLEILADDDSP